MNPYTDEIHILTNDNIRNFTTDVAEIDLVWHGGDIGYADDSD